MEQTHPGAAWGPILAAAAAEAGAQALEYAGPAGALTGAAGGVEVGEGIAASGAEGGAIQLPTVCFGAGGGPVLWAATDDSAFADELSPWLAGCAAALGLPAGGAMDMTPPPQDAVVLTFRTEGGATATLWLAPAVLGATDPVPADFPQLGGSGGAAAPSAGIDLLLEVPMVLTVELGRTERRIRDVLALQRGSIVELDRLAGEPVDLMVNGHLIAHAEVVVVDENFGVRITDIVSATERISQMQGGT